ncbi:MAG TPA: hypothetical protein VM680_01255, partial [Verrucomicrobiae bacterium]|nr:hypothetical protein [Verrucomicrobiae bacterium]
FGTLYGTIEVAPAIAREIAGSMLPGIDARRIRSLAILWVSTIAAIFLTVNIVTGAAPALVVLLTPANLFTGVLACGFVCLLAVWADYKWLNPADRLPLPLVVLNVIGGVLFLLLGLKGYIDIGSWIALAIFVGTICAGFVAAILLRARG